LYRYWERGLSKSDIKRTIGALGGER